MNAKFVQSTLDRMANPYESPRVIEESVSTIEPGPVADRGMDAFQRCVVYLIVSPLFFILVVPAPRTLEITTPALLAAGPLWRSGGLGVSAIGWTIFFAAWVGIGLFATKPRLFTAAIAALAVAVWPLAGLLRL